MKVVSSQNDAGDHALGNNDKDPADDQAQEHGFAVACKSKKGGRNFFITFQKPVKYKVAKYLSRRIYSCVTSCIRFRSASLLR